MYSIICLNVTVGECFCRPTSHLPEPENSCSIFPDQCEFLQPLWIILQQPGMSFPGYRLLDTFKKPGNIIGLIGRVDDDVNVLWHNDKKPAGQIPEVCKESQSTQ